MTLGINTTAMAVPAVACHYVFRRAVSGRSDSVAAAAAMAAGALAIMMAAAIVALALWAAGEQFVMISKLVLLAHLPVAAVEALVTASVVAFLRKVRPEVFQSSLLLPEHVEVSDV